MLKAAICGLSIILSMLLSVKAAKDKNGYELALWLGIMLCMCVLNG